MELICGGLIFIVLLMVVFGRNMLLLFLAIGAVEWLTMARIVRGQTLSLKNREFVEAARASGVSELRRGEVGEPQLQRAALFGVL